MNRYIRQVNLPEIGEEGQEKLKKAKVLIVGVGGLGSPIALYLAAAGVGTLGLIDDDVVSLSNLQRQVLYVENEVGEPKVDCAERRLKSLNSSLIVNKYNCRLTSNNVDELITNYDVVVDGCDNYETRYAISDACMKYRKPYIYAAIAGFEGQVSVLCAGENPKSYRDLFPDNSSEPKKSSDSIAVLGTTPAVVGSVQTNETIKLIAGFGEPLIGKLWTVDLRNLQTYIFSL